MWIRKLWKSGGLTKRYSRASCRDVLCAVTETAMASFALTSGESAMRASRKPSIDRSSFAQAVLAATADAKMKIRLRLTARKFVGMAKCGFASIDQNSSHKIDKGRNVTDLSMKTVCLIIRRVTPRLPVLFGLTLAI